MNEANTQKLYATFPTESELQSEQRGALLSFRPMPNNEAIRALITQAEKTIPHDLRRMRSAGKFAGRRLVEGDLRCV